MGETETERQTDFASHLPVPLQPVLEREQQVFSTRYRPNSVFLAHLIATRDGEPQTRVRRRAEPVHGVNTYRAVAALPRQRAAGHLLKTER
ncbi:hypothetical protein [Roseibium salinum]|uniref:Uncharacterized protein n=1 Tax=Roseibium salinum TaxID=1604349 RepID=A0ABT3R6N1_9HYPH|nr:hypothetical protein [Roseibium sp. DSM 29163]MCX2724947.1 hypothetical protein [Roseibium sp. DSM 29163]